VITTNVKGNIVIQLDNTINVLIQPDDNTNVRENNIIRPGNIINVIIQPNDNTNMVRRLFHPPAR
jgi:hypothetical protein